MGFDIGQWTVKVLTDGLPPAPDHLERSQTIPIASWQRGDYGAVLFIRRWRNDQIDTDSAITTRDEGGAWEYPGGWGGSGWIADPLHRPDDGWEGKAVLWLGVHGTGFQDAHGTPVSIWAQLGVAARTVDAIEVATANERYLHPITSAGGAFIIATVNEPATLTAVDADGAPFLGPDGEAYAHELDPDIDWLAE